MYYNHRHEPAPVFTPGDKVWLDGSDIATNRPLSNLSHRRLGPFVVEACVGHGTYRLALPPVRGTPFDLSSSIFLTLFLLLILLFLVHLLVALVVTVTVMVTVM
jgi:hypothetical protein